MTKIREYLTESSLSRIWQFVEDDSKSFAVISASRKSNSRKVNEEKYNELKKIVRELGYGFIEMRGGYIETEGFVKEKSLFIPSIPKEKAIELGVKYDQDSILFKDENEFVAIGTNRDTGIGKVLTNFLKSSEKENINLAKKAIKELFSSLLKGSHRGRKFKFNIQLEEKQDIGLWGRMSGKKPNWFVI